MTWARDKLSDLQPFIQYLIDTKEEEWAVGVVRTKGNKQNCLFGHLVNWAYGKEFEGDVSPIWDIFEARWAMTYTVYPINDGKNPEYQQSSPKQRVTAFMQNLWLGLEADSNTLWEQEYERHKINEKAL